jgi:hypothetical protein
VRLIVSRKHAAGALPIARFRGCIPRIGLALCPRQNSLPQRAVPSTAF